MTRKVSKESIMEGMSPSQKTAYLKSEALDKYGAQLLDNKSGISQKASKDLVTINKLREKAGLIKGKLVK